MNHFYITHFAGCVVLLNKETFHSDVQVNSVYIHDTRSGQQQVVKEGQSGWVLQAGFSRASFRRIPRNGKSYFAVVSLHINNQYAKKRGIGKKPGTRGPYCNVSRKQVDVVAGDFNGAAWRRQSGSDHRPTSTIEEAFANTCLPIPLGPTPLWGPGDVPGEWTDVCGFLKPRGSENEWQVRMHGAFTIPFDMLGIRHTELPPRSVGPPPPRQCAADRVSRDDKYRRPSLRKRNSPYDHGEERRLR